MSNVKKYINDSWKVLASGQATGISVLNPKLLKDNEVVTSVDAALERHENDIQKLYRNVAWLALNGGGGNGSGGPEISVATCTIKVNGVLTDSDPIIMNTDGLLITLEDINVALQKSWTVKVRIGSTQIGLYSASYIDNVILINYKDISEKLSNHAGNITITASYSDDTNGLFGAVTWNGTIIESVVNITAVNNSFNIDHIDNALFTYEYSVGIIGGYNLGLTIYKNGLPYSTKVEQIQIISNDRETKSINVSDLLGITSESDELEVAGVYNIKTILSNIENPLVLGSCENTITIVTDDILVSTTILSQDRDNPNEVSISGTINVNYTAYLLGFETFKYDYFIVTDSGEYKIKNEANGYFGLPVLDYVSVYNKEWALADNTVTFRIKIVAGDKSKIFDYYVKFVEADASFINISEQSKAHLVSEFLSREYSTGQGSFNLENSRYLNGGNYYNITSNITPINDNYLSVISTDINGTPYLRLSNGAFAKLENWSFNKKSYNLKSLLSSLSAFTLSICFKADYHPDDNRTILCFGSIDANTGEVTKGISIDVHDIYINNSSKVILTDNVVNIVDIVCYPVDITDDSGKVIRSYIVKIFLDGVLTAIESIPTFLELGDCIYLGGKLYNTEEGVKNDYLCDCNIYNLLLFDTSLSDLDILTNYINNKISHEYVNFLPNYKIITSELLKNFCEINSNNCIESKLFKNNQYTIDFLLENGLLSTENLNTYAKILGIPVMLIDVSQDSAWTFNNFVNQLTTSDRTLTDTEGKTILYWDPTENNSLVLSINNCTIGLLGTSTLLDAVKNINITVPNDTAFIPKSTWFPELTYTLKADIVDSSHSNNASIGKFINSVLGTKDGAYFPFDDTALKNVYESDYVKNLHNTATLKHTVEGFPVLLIMKFNTQKASDAVSVTPLGIYSFNLGRDAFRNLGFTKVNSIKDKNGDKPNITTFPCVFEQATIDETRSDANWIEINDTNSISDMITAFNGTILPDNFNSSEGDFWLDHDSILDQKFSVRYGDKTQPSLYNNFKTFVKNVMNLPIEGTYSTYSTPINFNNIVIPQVTGPSYDLYKINNDGKYVKTNEKQSFITDANALLTNLGFNEESAYKYFVIALLFGLIDNFGKNSTYRSWNGNLYFVDFYDLDSALGGGNLGYLDISPDVWIKFLKNQDDGSIKDYGYVSETYKEGESLSGSVVSANHSKLWLSLDTELIRARRGVNKTSSIYSGYWFELRNILLNISDNAGYNDFVEYFINEFYVKQTGNCGSLLFNYDYKLKYLLQFTGNDFVSSKDLTKLHGRKIAYSREWLKKHILFLDSLFYWRNNSGEFLANFKNNINNKVNGTVYTTPKKFAIKTNSPIILKHSIGNATNTSYFIPENKEIWVNAGNNSSSSALAWSITNSSNITNLGNDEVNLSALNLSGLSMSTNLNNWDINGLPSITELNLKNNVFKGNGFSLEAFELGDLSELRVLDFSGTSGTTFSLALNKYSPSEEVFTKYTKLTKIDISDSKCITDLTIPNIPLKELIVRNSAINTFILRYLKYLNNVDLTGCDKLTEIIIDSCDSYTDFSVNSLSNITKISILNCPNIKNISITKCPNLKSINIENCEKVTNITILGCNILTGTLSDNYVTISGCHSLKSLLLNNNTQLLQVNVADSNLNNISTLNISNTKVISIKGKSDSAILDLSDYTALTNFNISNNSQVTHILFSNIKNKPIILSNRFNGCSNLTRIYGYVKISYSGNSSNSYGIFKDCSKFSIHGTNAAFWKNISIKNDSRIRTPWEMLTGSTEGEGYENITLTDLFQEGGGVTNICFNDKSNILTYAFNNTNITLFDIYYLLCAFALSDISTTQSIYHTFSARTNMFNWSNNCHPDRYMFYKCSNITSIYYGFNFSGTTLLLSPLEGKDNGLFSPLTNLKTLYHFDRVGSVVFSRKLFHRVLGKYAITNISFMDIVNVFDDDADFPSYSAYTNRSNNLSKLGNFENFFKDIPDISKLYALGQLEYLDIDSLKFPKTITSIASAFNALYAKGTLDLQKLFEEESQCLELCKVFIINGSKTTYGDKATMIINKDSFKNLKNIVHVGYRHTDRNTYYGNATSTSFAGAGLLKNIEGSFPTDIVKDCKNLVTFGGFFRETNGTFNSVVNIPGDMFKNNTKLQAVGGLMYNAQFPFQLSGDGFSNCPDLEDVSYMCYFTISANKRSPLIGEIPYRLFYHGKTSPTTIVYKGSNSVNKPEIPENPSDLETKTVVYDNYNKNISNISYCFYGCSGLEYYRNRAEVDYVENNSNYTPFKWIYNEDTKTWIEGTDFYEKDASWGYTGNPEDKNSEYKYLENIDNIELILGSTLHSEVLNYMCSPDLLRYCTNDANININGLFSNCGLSYSSDSGGSINTADGESIYNTGITGRIVPYLLQPVSNVTSIKEMFRYCRRLSSYKTEEKIYLIPLDFFHHATNINNLQKAFLGLAILLNTLLNVFDSLKSPLDIRCIFANGVYESKKSSYSSIFINNKLSHISGAFSYYDLTIDNSSDLLVTINTTISKTNAVNSNIKFEDNFNVSKIPNADNIGYVYYGWGNYADDEAIEDNNYNYG